MQFKKGNHKDIFLMMEFQEGIPGGKEGDVFVPPITLVSDYAHNPRTKSQAVPAHSLAIIGTWSPSVLSSHARWSLLTPGHFFLQREPKLTIFLESPTSDGCHFLMKSQFWFPKMVKNVQMDWAWHG